MGRWMRGFTAHHRVNLNQNSLNRNLCSKESLSSPKSFPRHAAWDSPDLSSPQILKFQLIAPSKWTLPLSLHRSDWDHPCSFSMLLGDLSLSYSHPCTHVCLQHPLNASPVFLQLWPTDPLHQSYLGALRGRFLGPTTTKSESLGVGQVPINVWEPVTVHCARAGLHASPCNDIQWPLMYPQKPKISKHLDVHPPYKNWPWPTKGPSPCDSHVLSFRLCSPLASTTPLLLPPFSIQPSSWPAQIPLAQLGTPQSAL